MTAITAAVNRKRKGVARQRSFVMTASTTIPKGALVAVPPATGLALNATDVAANPVVGVASETVTSTAAGGEKIQVEYDAEWLFAATSVTQLMVGTAMEVVDNNTVDETAGAGNIVVGKCTEFVTTTSCWVQVPGLTI